MSGNSAQRSSDLVLWLHNMPGLCPTVEKQKVIPVLIAEMCLLRLCQTPKPVVESQELQCCAQISHLGVILLMPLAMF